MKRRSVLLGLSALGIAGAGVSGWRLWQARDEDAVAAVIFKRLGYLKLDEQGVREFARDFAARHVVSGSKLRIIGAAGPLYRFLPEKGALTRGIQHGEERIVTYFLLSSDFFAFPQDERRTVSYVGYFDALRGCGNPFAHPAIQAT